MILIAFTTEDSVIRLTTGFTSENIQPEEPGLQLALAVKNPPAKARDRKDVGSVSRLGRPPQEATHPAPIPLPGESQGKRGLEDYRLSGHIELDTTEVTACTRLCTAGAGLWRSSPQRDADLGCRPVFWWPRCQQPASPNLPFPIPGHFSKGKPPWRSSSLYSSREDLGVKHNFPLPD